MTDAVAVQPTPCRKVTDAEVDHLSEFGWVLLKRFVDPNVVQDMLHLAREIMGDDADSNPFAAETPDGFAYFNPQRSPGLSHPLLKPLIHAVGKNAKLLQRRTGAGGRAVEVRYYTDYFAPKLSAATTSKHGGNGATAFHQDFISHSVDRTGGMTFWFPLEPYGAEAGTMSFVSGSHRTGVLGHFMTYGDGDVMDAYPALRELEMSEPMTYELGDVSVHDHLTVHGTGENLMDRPRWAYIVLTQPEDVRWNGSPCPNFDWTTMKPLDAFSDETLPVIS